MAAWTAKVDDLLEAVKDTVRKTIVDCLDFQFGKRDEHAIRMEEVYTASEFKTIIRKDYVWLNKMMERGEIPYLQLGEGARNRRFCGWQVRAWMDELQKRQAAYRKAEAKEAQEETA